MKHCPICNKSFNGYGHNPEPVLRWIDGACCDECNVSIVIPARIANAAKIKEEANG